METKARQQVRWDKVVRLTHWGIAAAILVNFAITEEGSATHVWIGYAAGALLLLRLAWGLVGTAPARFRAFPPSPARAIGHVRDIVAGRHEAHASHNPLGALMAYALWATLAVVVASGLAMERGSAAISVISQSAPSAGRLHVDAHEERGEREGGEEGEEGMIGEIHEAAANLLVLLAALHLGGVAFETRRGGRGLVRAMIVGRGGRDDARIA